MSLSDGMWGCTLIPENLSCIDCFAFCLYRSFRTFEGRCFTILLKLVEKGAPVHTPCLIGHPSGIGVVVRQFVIICVRAVMASVKPRHPLIIDRS